MRRDPCLQVARVINAPTVVEPCCSIKVRISPPPTLVDALRQSIAVGCASRSISHHLSDCRIRAWVVDFAGDIRVASSGAVVVLHQSWIADAVVGSRNSDATTRFLDDCCEDEAMVDSSVGSDSFDCVPDGTNFWSRIICLAEGITG